MAIVLGARNEHRLLKLERALADAAIPHVAIRETDGRYAGQLMAIGLVPTESSWLDRDALLNDFHMLRECANETG